ncbi:MAG: hypothetical protein JKX78_05810 [Alteromonadaceae bacterium]|nr:hypothetical protein [Alteromonadaceae bacterium]
MKIFKVGDTQQAVCESCKSIDNATFALRDVPFSDGSGIVKKVLVGVCDKCDDVILTPQQSAPAIKKQLETQKKSVETRVPAHMVDILNLASAELGANTDFSSFLMKYYFHFLSHEKGKVNNLDKFLESDLAKGRAQKRISLKGTHIIWELGMIKKHSHIESTTDVVKAVVLKINEDVLVHPKQRIINHLKGVAAAFA